MCQLKSAIILKDRVFVPDYDSHQKMLEELGIEDTRENASRVFVRAELLPPNGDVFTDIATWTYRVDQDILPDWYVEEYDKSRMVDAVKVWAQDRIHIGVDGLVINSGAGHYIKDCHDVVIGGSASVKYICGSASVKCIDGSASVECIGDSASVESIGASALVEYICDSVSVQCIDGSASVECIGGSASVKCIGGSASVECIDGSASVKSICGSASVKYIRDSVSVKYICGSASVKKVSGFACISVSKCSDWKNIGSLILCQNATFRDLKNKKIYQCGDFELISVGDGEHV